MLHCFAPLHLSDSCIYFRDLYFYTKYDIIYINTVYALGTRTVKIKFGIEALVLEKVVLAVVQVLALKKVPLKNIDIKNGFILF